MIKHILDRRKFMKSGALLAGSLTLAPTCFGQHNLEAGKPNILLLLTDDQRGDTIGALGNPHIKTPNLDEIAQSGFAFNNAYCLGADVGAVCLPSRNMLMSGRAYFRFTGKLGKNSRNYASADKPNFPDSMKAAGYETYHHGKSGNTARLIHKRFDHTRYVVHHNKFKSVQPGKIVVDDAISFLKSRSSDRPFFIYLGVSEPHDLRIPAQEYLDMYRRRDIPLPENYLPFHPFNNGELTIRDECLEAWPRTREAIRRHLHEYYGMITGLDHHFGRLFQTLKDLGQFENTVIIFSSDNGLAIGSHGLMGKQSVYEHSGKVPLIFTGPGVPKGRSDALVYLMDIFPTVCELVGAPVPDGLDGRSLASVIGGREPGVRETLFSSYRQCQRAVRDERWKLIRYPRINKTQLFDLRNDPHETEDLSGDPGQAERIERMISLISRWQRKLGDTQPLTSDTPNPAPVDVEFFRKNAPPKKAKKG
ncbi:MAG: sulfatase-like hydrolase/transferase [Sedimentisphaerales bacterium]|nr:sulfatase-like hydrolase/transferase [Sedimentisphaerales bacterium]